MVLALGPVGCGFQPIYARSGGAAASPMADKLASVRVAGIEDRAGQKLRNTLVLALNPRGEPASPAYVLNVRLIETPQSMATSKDGNSTIGRINILAEYSLQDGTGDRTLYTGRARSFSSYRYLGPRYASTASEREAESSALTEIGEEIRSGLAAYFADPETFGQREKKRQESPALGPQFQPDGWEQQ